MADTALQRKNMVESQVRPSDVTDRRITSAMMALPRERFVPRRLADLAYIDTALALDGGRGLMAPRDFARLVQLANINEDERVLDIASGAGYSAAVLSRLARNVTALESDASASAAAASTLADLGAINVAFVTGALAEGWPDRAPYDVIILEGAVDAIPVSLKAQLAPAGRLVAVLMERGVGRAVVLSGGGGDAAPRIAFEAAAPRLPGFAPSAKGFQF